MNEFFNEINEIYKLAGVQVNEEQGYFTDWKSIRDKVIKMYIRGRLEETGMLEDDEEIIRDWLYANASADMIEKLCDETGAYGETPEYWIASYINKNPDEGGVVSNVAYQFIGEYFDRIANDLQEEFEENNLIYRLIDSDKSPKEIAQILKTNGTGNCWAKQEDNAKAYYGNGNDNEYCLIGEATIDNVNWETTIYLRMMAEWENEVRLKKDSPIHIVGIKYYHYDGNLLDKKDHMKVDLYLNVGHSYVFEESKQVNESIAYVSDNELKDIILKNPTKRELRQNNLDITRCMVDSEGNWYFGDMYFMLHCHMESLLRNEARFPYYDGSDCYGISYYDVNNNEFWYNNNDVMTREDCIKQYNNSEYLRTTFPNATIERNPYFWGNDNQLNESIRKLEIQNSPMIYEVTSLNNIKALLHRCRFGLRGIMNNSTGHLFVCDNEQLIHHNLMKIINKNIEPVDSYSKLSFYNNKEKALDSEYVYEDVWGYGWDLYTDNEIYVWICNHDLSGDAYNLVSNLEMVYPPEDEDGYIDVQQLNEEVAYEGKEFGDIILKNPTRKELKDWDLMNCRVVLDWVKNDFYFGDAYSNIHDDIISKVNAGENDSLYYDYHINTFINRDEYMDENEKMDMETRLKEWLSGFQYIKTTFGDFNTEISMSEEPFESVQIAGNQLNEEIIHAEHSNYDDYMAVVLKNPTRKELRDNEMEHSRFICYEDGTWLFFDSMQWIHEQILSKYNYGYSNGMGFYDLRNNEFIFMESMNYDEDEEGYEAEVSYYEDKCKKWLLTKPYIRENFGLNPNVKIYGDWVDSPW